MPVIWGVTDLAELVGASRQTVWSRYQRGLLPDPDYWTNGAATPYWSDAHARQIEKEWVGDLRRRTTHKLGGEQ
jgi:hypothetical protein